jgi:hypothetical protein
MPRNGSGVYTLVPTINPVVSGTIIATTWANPTLADIASAITNSIASNGETPILANLPMSGFRHTNVSPAQAQTDYLDVASAQQGIPWYLTALNGNNVIIATAAYAMTEYVVGQVFEFSPIAPNTGPATLNINGINAFPITKNGGNALTGGELGDGTAVQVLYNGTNFEIIGQPSGSIEGYSFPLSGSLAGNTPSVNASGTYEVQAVNVTVPTGYSLILNSVHCYLQDAATSGSFRLAIYLNSTPKFTTSGFAVDQENLNFLLTSTAGTYTLGILISNTDSGSSHTAVGIDGWSAFFNVIPTGVVAGSIPENNSFNNNVPVTDITIATHTLQTQDRGFDLFVTYSGGGCTITIPDDVSDTIFGIGAVVFVTNGTASENTQIVAAGGVTTYAPAGTSGNLAYQGAMAALHKVASNTWNMVGNLS